jgi:hypothetical protein
VQGRLRFRILKRMLQSTHTLIAKLLTEWQRYGVARNEPPRLDDSTTEGCRFASKATSRGHSSGAADG